MLITHSDIDSTPSTPIRGSLEDHEAFPLLTLSSTPNMSAQKPHVEERDLSHAESDRHFEREWRDEKWQNRQLSQAAEDRSNVEHTLTPGQAIKAYPMAIFWCLAVSMCVIMEGYDTILIGNLFAYPSFQRKCTISSSSLKPTILTLL
jgi:hypothetical protein